MGSPNREIKFSRDNMEAYPLIVMVPKDEFGIFKSKTLYHANNWIIWGMCHQVISEWKMRT